MYERLWKRFTSKGATVEFGCGVGYFARRLSKYSTIYAYEVNEYARKSIKTVAPKAICVNSLSEIHSGCIASITALHVLEHITDHDLIQIFSEFDRLLKPQGIIITVMPNKYGMGHQLKGNKWSAFSDRTHINLKSCKEWKYFFEKNCRLKVSKCFADGYYDFPYSNKYSGLSDLLRLARTLVQFTLAVPILNKNDGENTIFILKKS